MAGFATRPSLAGHADRGAKTNHELTSTMDHLMGADQQYYIAGKARMTVFAAQGNARTFNYQAGDVGYVPKSMPHYVENIGSEPLRFLELFNAPRFVDVSLTQWMALTPHELVAAHLNINRDLLDGLPKDKRPVV
jgi:oxalate decarboxylase